MKRHLLEGGSWEVKKARLVLKTIKCKRGKGKDKIRLKKALIRRGEVWKSKKTRLRCKKR